MMGSFGLFQSTKNTSESRLSIIGKEPFFFFFSQNLITKTLKLQLLKHPFESILTFWPATFFFKHNYDKMLIEIV